MQQTEDHESMFKRKITSALYDWRRQESHKPLIVRGARQVGKTTVLHEFGKEFENYIYLNLESAESRRLFETEMPLDDRVMLMFAQSAKKRQEGDTLLFIDEIQNSPKAIEMLRYFYEEQPGLYVVAAGSLLENIVDVQVSFPVGRVQYLPIRPCSFAEFVGALHQENLLDMMYDKNGSHVAHSRLMSLFGQYAVVGGMPEAVQRFADTGDLLAMDSIYETLLQAYRDDVEKYTKAGKLSDVVRFVLEHGWLMAGETVTLTGFAGSSYKSNVVGEALRMLQKAMLLELVYPTTHTEAPIVTELRRQPKLMWLDTGLVNYAAGIRGDIIRARDIMDTWRGRVAEHIVAQELLTLNDKISQRRAFWLRGKGGESAEVDFVWQMDSTVIPIEVKSGTNSHLRSLHSFVDNSPIDFAVRVWSGEFSVDDVHTTFGGKPFRLINLPFYMVGNMEKIIRTYI